MYNERRKKAIIVFWRGEGDMVFGPIKTPCVLDKWQAPGRAQSSDSSGPQKLHSLATSNRKAKKVIDTVNNAVGTKFLTLRSLLVSQSSRGPVVLKVGSIYGEICLFKKFQKPHTGTGSSTCFAVSSFFLYCKQIIIILQYLW